MLSWSKPIRGREYALCALLLCIFLTACESTAWQWERVQGRGDVPVARHESGLVAFDGRIYILGGRRINPVNVFDPVTGVWSTGVASPIELHHFQPVVFEDSIYLIGAMTGNYPNETPIARIVRYLPDQDRFEWGREIPISRRRGGAGVVVHDGQFYIVGGITNGHVGGSVSWLDRYDPNTDQWTVLPDAPHSRDHIQAAVVDDKLYVFGGRRTSQRTGNVLNLTESNSDVFDLQKGTWEAVDRELRIPTERAGQSVLAWNDEIVVLGGESASQQLAHDEVEAFNVTTKRWRRWPNLNRGRHGTGVGVIGEFAYTMAGSGERGGSPELIHIERLALPIRSLTSPTDGGRSHQTWDPVVLQFQGPDASEHGTINPFLDYRLHVTFESDDLSLVVRGFYAADGRAAQTGATSGGVW
ncbi:MAG: kelch repeat-containing protein, partial [Pseudomonadota bacterium]